MKDMLMCSISSSIMHSVLDVTIASRFDLMLIGIGIIGYVVLSSSRNAHAAKKAHQKVDVCKDSQVAATASVQLTRVLDSMARGEDVSSITAEMDAFFVKYPEHTFALPEVHAVLDFCSSFPTEINEAAEKVLPDMLFEHVKSTEEWHILSAFIHYYMKSKQPDKACDIFELHYATFFDVELDEDTEWRLIMAALQCKHQTLAEHLLQTSQTNASKRIMSIQKWWKRKATDLCESRVERMGSVLNQLSSMFNERFPFEEHSDDESTCFLGDDSDCEDSSDDESWCDEVDRS